MEWVKKTVLCTKLESFPTCKYCLKALHFLQKTAWTALLAGLGKNEDPKEGASFPMEGAVFLVQNGNDEPTGSEMCINALRKENGTEASILCRENLIRKQENENTKNVECTYRKSDFEFPPRELTLSKAMKCPLWNHKGTT